MIKLLIVYESRTGNTEAMAKAVQEGALSAGASVSLKKAAETTSDDLLSCDAVIFGTPNYFDYMAGTIKDLWDRTHYAVKGKADNKPYAAFSSAGAGGKGALDSIDSMCSHLRLKEAAKGIIAKGKPSPEVLEECKQQGKKMAQS